MRTKIVGYLITVLIPALAFFALQVTLASFAQLCGFFAKLAFLPHGIGIVIKSTAIGIILLLGLSGILAAFIRIERYIDILEKRCLACFPTKLNISGLIRVIPISLLSLIVSLFIIAIVLRLLRGLAIPEAAYVLTSLSIMLLGLYDATRVCQYLRANIKGHGA